MITEVETVSAKRTTDLDYPAAMSPVPAGPQGLRPVTLIETLAAAREGDPALVYRVTLSGRPQTAAGRDSRRPMRRVTIDVTPDELPDGLRSLLVGEAGMRARLRRRLPLDLLQPQGFPGLS
jgi:hypothetical protein